MTKNISDEELNSIIINAPTVDGAMPAAKKWIRADVGIIETYVGDGIYVVTLIEHLPKTVGELKKNCENVEEIVAKYLRGEGFIGEEYLYVALQRFDLTNPPKGVEFE